MRPLTILDESDLPWIGEAVDVVERLVGEPWRVAIDLLERSPVASSQLSAVIGAMHRVLGGGGRNARLARRTRGLLLGPPALDREARDVRIASTARALGLTPDGVERALWSDLARERPVELPHGRPSELELAAVANIQLIQRALRRAGSVVLRIWGDAGQVIRAASVRGLLSTLSVGPAGSTVIDIVGPLALVHRTSVYGRALSSLVPFLGGCERFELELTAESAAAPYTIVLRSPVLLPPPPAELSQTSVRARLARDLVRRAGLDVITTPAPIVAARSLVCPDLTIDVANVRWYIEIIGFWTAAYVARKVARYRAAGITNVIFCIDELRGCEDDQVAGPDARVIGYRRNVDSSRVLEMIGAP